MVWIVLVLLVLGFAWFIFWDSARRIKRGEDFRVSLSDLREFFSRKEEE